MLVVLEDTATLRTGAAYVGKASAVAVSTQVLKVGTETLFLKNSDALASEQAQQVKVLAAKLMT